MGIKMKKLKRGLAILVALSMLISTSNLSVYASESSIPEQLNETTESVYEAETYRVTLTALSPLAIKQAGGSGRSKGILAGCFWRGCPIFY